MVFNANTDAKKLNEMGVKIWDGNSSREYLDSIGLSDYREGDCGPIYGFQWRNFNGTYKGPDIDYIKEGDGVDQLASIIEQIKTNPGSRRMVMSGWNPYQEKKMALPPCFVENTPVLTEKGYKCIQDITKSDKLFTHTGEIHEIRQIHKTMYTGPIHKLKFQYVPSIITTPEHPFYVREVIYKNNPKLVKIKCSEPMWINAEDLTKNHYVGIKINNKDIIPKFTITKKINKTASKNINVTLDDKDLWFLLGYYLGDGWSRWDRKGTFYLVFKNDDEDELLNRFRTKVTMRVKQRQSGCIVYECHNYILSHILKQFGRKAQNKVIPNWVLDSPKELISHFLDGYIKADGCSMQKNGNDYIDITTTSKDIAHKIQLILFKLNIFASIKFQERPNTCIIEGRLCNQNNTYSISYIKNRKRQIRSFIKNGYAWVPLRNNYISKIEKQYVYNFDVNEDHTYIVNNVCVHNCHSLYQFYVNDGKLSCQMYQRSGDMFLGVPFNIASTALITYMLAHLTGLKPHKIILVIGDAHIYECHTDAVKTQIERTPTEFCKLRIKEREDGSEIKNPEDFRMDDFELVGYKSQGRIKAKMVV